MATGAAGAALRVVDVAALRSVEQEEEEQHRTCPGEDARTERKGCFARVRSVVASILCVIDCAVLLF